ncbi:unnamed protein product [Caenorhabditis angaria]|uniref:Uncharacterized protein n=1 Tax=Caenorhabditis angaria TaxID=860376 RepID=A0A9P1N5J1_9PELO|nr:unnamed protein product [Caenorhabditis angaria]
MGKLCPFLGPKMSAFIMVMSVWGIIFLGILGCSFWNQAITLFPDLEFEKCENRKETCEEYLVQTIDEIEDKYNRKAYQCWGAAGLYLVTLIVVYWQNRYNTTHIF